MSATFDFSESVPNFDDADFFLSTLLTTVPTLGKNDPYDLNPSDFASADIGDLITKKETNSLENEVQNTDTSSSQSHSPNSNIHSYDNTFDANNHSAPLRLSFSSASYSELLPSQNSQEDTPNTSLLSPHTLPEGVLDSYKPLFNKTNFKKEPLQDTLNSDTVVSPKAKVAAKDKVSKPGKKTKVSHNMIEKKYRTNINTKIFELRDAVPTLRLASGRNDLLLSELEGLAPASKLNKASVLTKATEYIKHLEKKNDSMLDQISSLQQLINSASADPSRYPTQQQQQPRQINQQQMPMLVPPQNQAPFQPQGQPFAENFGGFGFVPTDQSFNTTVNDFGLQDTAPPMSTQQSVGYQDRSFSSNWAMGGLATFVGSSVLNEDNFRGMSALPFVPSILSNPSTSTLQILSIFRVGLVMFGIYHLALPFLGQFQESRNEKAVPSSSKNGVLLTWITVLMGLQVPKPLAPSVKDTIKAHILTGQASKMDFLKDYFIVSSSEVNFETCFLTLLLTAMLSRMYPALFRVLRTNFKSRMSLLSNLEYNDDDESLKKLNKLVKSSDGYSLFTSRNLIQRFINIASGKTVIADIASGENHLAYVELFKCNRNNLYGMIFDWRIMEVLHELNLAYLDQLLAGEEEKERVEKTIKKDLDRIGLLLDDSLNAIIVQYYLSMKCLLSPDVTPKLMESMKANIVERVNKVNLYFDGQDLTDDEAISDSEDQSSITESDKAEGEQDPTNHKKDIVDLIRNQKSIIYSMNLMNEEKFIVLASSLIFFYKEAGEFKNLKMLLQHLQFRTSKIPLSLLSFTCLLKVVSSLVDDEGEIDHVAEVTENESYVLESLVKILRKWITEDYKKQFMNFQIRSLLSDLILLKGMILNDM